MDTGKAPLSSDSSSPLSEEDYIDMEVTSSSSSSNFFCYSIESTSPSQSRDFEFQFQMASCADKTEPTTSPADELFYKGKLLPLHLPPRLQMVQKLLCSPNNGDNATEKVSTNFSENDQIPFISISTPLEFSCNTSPAESCRPSCELNSDEYLFGLRGEIKGLIQDVPRKSWSKKMKQIRKSSRAYLKALFGKSVCSNKSCSKAVYNEKSENVSIERESSGKLGGFSRKIPSGRIEDAVINNNSTNNHRRSFSGAIQRISATKSSSSSSSSTSSSGSSSLSSSFSFSSNSNGICDNLQLFKRSISANSEIETSIEGAIAHCKQSQNKFKSSNKIEKTESQIETCSLSASKVLAYGNRKTSPVCRI